ncbi:helix-turn-helix domain-containing protein [Salinicola rhizosphaerae]|uniref:Helix-turn-helix domain-containing protein n=1 Tax=Salinicola rhizosphaerae TaxID=1443141 RepID=A0ABQ3ECW3_9GAMM|nr:helix-turn-helix domain-containing protein [Salinicola rhizosphaerae]GHB30695.1 hypothetical protein GCM10009038_31860 [Salinicola rhizosphaerae]
MSEERAFRGVWIPADVWLNRGLSMQEKVMLVEIDSLQSATRGCYKSNKKLAEFFQLSPNRVSEIISSLAKKGWVRIEQIRNGKQIIERRIFMATPFEKPEGGSRNPEEGYSENGANPVRDPEEGYSENREERGSGVRGSVEGNPSLPGAGDVFDRAQSLDDDGQPLPTASHPMTESWEPEWPTVSKLLAGTRMTEQAAKDLLVEHGITALEKFRTKYLAVPGRVYSDRVWHRHLADYLATWQSNLARQTPQPTQTTGGVHAAGNQRDSARRLSPGEARRIHEQQQRERAAGGAGPAYDADQRAGHG